MPPNNQFFGQTPAVPVGSNSVPPQPQPQIPSQPQPQGSNTTDTTKTVQKPKNPNSTQNTLLLSEVRDNMVIMADGTFRAVIACKSINFDLMSSREREGVEFSYQNFLNSLNFPIQILIRSQRIDIGPYIDHLSQIRQNQDNMLLNVLMDDYINFIDVLSQEANIMDKSFFITIPYYPKGDLTNLVEQGKGFFSKLLARPQNVITKIDAETYEKAKNEIKNRVGSVMDGLFQLGIQSAQLNTKELGELYYNFYNPDTAVREPLGDFTNTTATYIKKGEGQVPIIQPGSIF
jgi:type IV secretory pathway VirB4 component